jgi:23S rRNA pseudouridine1911/1915/1917 synthase
LSDVGAGGVRTARRHRFEVESGDADLRLDQLLARRIPGLSRGAARVLLGIGGVFVDRARARIASRKLHPGQVVEAWIGGTLERATASTALPGGRSAAVGRSTGLRRTNGGDAPGPRRDLRLVFHDEHLVVVDKPAGMPSAPTPEGDRGTVADLLRRSLLPGGPFFVVHRLDLATSGLLLLARTEAANRALSAAFRAHDVDREYLAVVDGAPPNAAWTIDEPIAGRRSVTHLRHEVAFGAMATRIRARLETGRTHQVRLHLAGAGHPVLGDRRHGRRSSFDPPRLALHATLLGFAHPATGQRLRFESPWPADLEAWLAALAARTAPAERS